MYTFTDNYIKYYNEWCINWFNFIEENLDYPMVFYTSIDLNNFDIVKEYYQKEDSMILFGAENNIIIIKFYSDGTNKMLILHLGPRIKTKDLKDIFERGKLLDFKRKIYDISSNYDIDVNEKVQENVIKIINNEIDPHEFTFIGLKLFTTAVDDYIIDNFECNSENIWDWGNLSINPNITKEVMEKNKEYDWYSPIIGMKADKENCDYISYYIHKYNIIPKFAWEAIKNNPNYPWDFYFISSHKDITFDIIIHNLNCNWNWEQLAVNPNITWDSLQKIKDLCDKTYHHELLNFRYNDNITLEVLQKHFDENYFSFNLSPCITLEFLRGSVKREDGISLSLNDSITWKMVEELDVDWDWEFMSSNLMITWDIVKNNIDKPWSWKKLSKHPNITLENILQNDKYPWVWDDVCLNPNLTWDIIKNNPTKKWNKKYLSKNRFSKSREEWIHKKMIENYQNIIRTEIYPYLKNRIL